MIDYITGTLTELEPTFAIVENNGIGYSINLTLPTYTSLASESNKQAKLYITEIIREDAHLLYGFTTKAERSLFELLMTVSGIGANSARLIMSAYSVGELRQIIATGNVMAMSAVKGIGNKTAQRILVDLKDKILKIHFSDNIESNESSGTDFAVHNEVKVASVEALTMLGFSAPACSKVVDKILQEHPQATIENVIKMALKML
ncbi:MAG: Holliday junction branch migration protein RuvA [Paludibacteraceae bacterium]|nr:Holliday junction branch migration protein RuvA [Paludibacteraceae bacterium]